MLRKSGRTSPRKLAAETKQKLLKNLPAKYGFGSLQTFIVALKRASDVRHRGVVTPKIKAEVVRKAKAGLSVPQISAALKLSRATIQNIKHEFGLTKKYRYRKKR